jgi:hypothetical protein
LTSAGNHGFRPTIAKFPHHRFTIEKLFAIKHSFMLSFESVKSHRHLVAVG